MIAFLKENARDSGLRQIKSKHAVDHPLLTYRFTLISIPPFTSGKKLLNGIIEKYYADSWCY